jgi:hypothetical protein
VAPALVCGIIALVLGGSRGVAVAALAFAVHSIGRAGATSASSATSSLGLFSLLVPLITQADGVLPWILRGGLGALGSEPPVLLGTTTALSLAFGAALGLAFIAAARAPVLGLVRAVLRPAPSAGGLTSRSEGVRASLGALIVFMGLLALASSALPTALLAGALGGATAFAPLAPLIGATPPPAPLLTLAALLVHAWRGASSSSACSVGAAASSPMV